MRNLLCVFCLVSSALFAGDAGQLLPPTISSAVNAVGQVNSAFMYKIVATGDAPITYAAAGLPEGLAVSGDTISGAPTEFGSFIVTLTATNLVGTDTESLTLDIQPLAVPDGSLSNIDRDGDGYSDELEIALNSLPNRQSSKPAGGPLPAPAGDLVIKRLRMTFNFRSDRKDTLSCKGEMVVGDNAARAGQQFVLDAGGVIQATSLDAKGSGTETEDKTFKFQLRLPRAGATGVKRIAKFTLSIRRRSFFNQLTDEGLTQTAGGTFTVPVTTIFDGKIYRANVQQIFTVRPNRSGKTK